MTVPSHKNIHYVSSLSQLPDTKGFLSLRSLSGSTAGSVPAANPNAVRFFVVIAAIGDAAEIDLLMTTYLSSTGIPPESFEVIFGGDRSSGGAAGPVRAWGHPKVPKEPVYLDGLGAPLGEPISQR
jgi:dolichol-phosphate mannosyltransferase